MRQPLGGLASSAQRVALENRRAPAKTPLRSSVSGNKRVTSCCEWFFACSACARSEVRER